MRPIAIVVGTAALVGAFILTLSLIEAPSRAPEAEVRSEGSASPRDASERRSRSESGTLALRERASPGEPEPKPRPVEPATPEEGEGPTPSSLDGLELVAISESERQNLKVPAPWSGVVIRSIAPDSGADQVGLRVDDVIVRARTTKIESVEDLERVAGDADHTLLTVSRGGFLFQLVLHRPTVK